MSLSLNPGAIYGGASTRLSPTGNRVGEFPDHKVQPTGRSSADESRAKQRSENYVAALRELRAQNHAGRGQQAAQTYLDVAHFEGNFHLINVYA